MQLLCECCSGPTPCDSAWCAVWRKERYKAGHRVRITPETDTVADDILSIAENDPHNFDSERW